MKEQAVERLEAKSPEEAIIEQISRDFNRAPWAADCGMQARGRQSDIGQS